MHSGTKYFAGHSDLLAGTLSVRSKEEWLDLCVSASVEAFMYAAPCSRPSSTRRWNLRTFTGTIIGSLDSWLLLRSLRTLSLRVERQAKTATALATWLNTLVGQGVVEKVWHTSLQEDAAALFGEGKQVQAGPACFSVLLKSKQMATYFPGHLKLFVVRSIA